MDQLPMTRVSLLVRIRDAADTGAWSEFVKIYAPVVYRFARNRGLQDADAADLMQEVFRSLSTAADRFDRSKGSFRGWLFTVTRNKIFNFLDKKRHHVQGSGDTGAHQKLAELADHATDEWDLEYERRLAAVAMSRVRDEFQPATWNAFTLTAVDGVDAKEAGSRLKMSPGAVYVAKSRVLARIKEEVSRLQAEEA